MIRKILLMLVTFLFTTGCWHILQPEDLAVISLAGFDMENDEYIITLQILNTSGIPTGGSGNGSSTQDAPVNIITAKGNTITEAIHASNRYTSGHFFWGHLSAVIVGEEFARAGIEPLISTLSRSSEMMESTNLYIARDMTAAELLNATIRSIPYPAEALRKMSTYSSMHTWTNLVRLNEALQTISYNPGTLAIPGLTTIHPNGASSKASSFYLKGMAVISNWKLKGWFDDKEAMGYTWILKNIAHHGFEVPYKNGILSIEALPIQLDINIRNKEDQIPEIEIFVQGKVRLSEIKNISFDAQNKLKESEKNLTKAINEAIKKGMETAINKAKALQADVFMFDERVRISQPGKWPSISSRWNEEIFPKVPFTIKVNISVRDIGEMYQTLPSKSSYFKNK